MPSARVLFLKTFPLWTLLAVVGVFARSIPDATMGFGPDRPLFASSGDVGPRHGIGDCSLQPIKDLAALGEPKDVDDDADDFDHLKRILSLGHGCPSLDETSPTNLTADSREMIIARDPLFLSFCRLIC